MPNKEELWQLIRSMRSNQISVQQIAKTLRLHRMTVYRYLQKPKPTIHKAHRSRIVTPRLITKIKSLMHAKPNMSTRKAEQILKSKGVSVSHTTIGVVCHRLGLSKRKHKKTFRLSALQRKKRVEYARAHLHDKLDELVFLDESPIEATSPPNAKNDGTWLLKGEEAKMVQMDKHPTKINAIAAISKLGNSKLYLYSQSMNGPLFTTYLSKILKDLRNGPFKNRSFRLVMDSASYHRYRHTEEWLKKRKVIAVSKKEWPASSPDINPIENLWANLQNRITSKSPRTMHALKCTATRVWNSFKQQEIAPYINALPSRYREIIKSKSLYFFDHMRSKMSTIQLRKITIFLCFFVFSI